MGPEMYDVWRPCSVSRWGTVPVVSMTMGTSCFQVQTDDAAGDHHFRKPANDITSQLEINFGDLGRPGRGRGGPRGGRGGRGGGSGGASAGAASAGVGTGGTAAGVGRVARGGRTEKVPRPD